MLAELKKYYSEFSGSLTYDEHNKMNQRWFEITGKSYDSTYIILKNDVRIKYSTIIDFIVKSVYKYLERVNFCCTNWAYKRIHNYLDIDFLSEELVDNVEALKK